MGVRCHRPQRLVKSGLGRRKQKVALSARLFQREPVGIAPDQESRGVAVQEAAHQIVARAAAGARYQNTPTHLSPTNAPDSPPTTVALRDANCAPWTSMYGAFPFIT